MKTKFKHHMCRIISVSYKFREELTVGCGRYCVATLSTSNKGISWWTEDMIEFCFLSVTNAVNKRYPVELLTIGSIMEQCFYKWLPILFVSCMHTSTHKHAGDPIHILPPVSYYSPDQQLTAVMQCAKKRSNAPPKARKKKTTASWLTWTVNCEIIRKYRLMFYEEGNTFKDSRNVFWWVTLNV